MSADDEQPWVDHWPLYEEAHSKFPVLADVEAARIKLARRYSLNLAWQEHRRMRRRLGAT